MIHDVKTKEKIAEFWRIHAGLWCCDASIAVVTFFTAALVSGCGGGSMQALPPGTVNMTGNWQFIAQSTTLGLTVIGSGALQQNGTSLSGLLTLSRDNHCAHTAALAGTVNGTTLNFQLEEGPQTVSFTGTVTSDGASASGNYTVSGGCANGDFGTWTGNRVL